MELVRQSISHIHALGVRLRFPILFCELCLFLGSQRLGTMSYLISFDFVPSLLLHSALDWFQSERSIKASTHNRSMWLMNARLGSAAPHCAVASVNHVFKQL